VIPGKIGQLYKNVTTSSSRTVMVTFRELNKLHFNFVTTLYDNNFLNAEFGVSKGMECDIFPFSALTLLVG